MLLKNRKKNILLIILSLVILCCTFVTYILKKNGKISNFSGTDNENTINKYIDKIYYINLDHRIDRKESIVSELESFNITNYERFNAIKDERGYIGCIKSHLECIKNAKKNGYKNVLILEDDFVFVVDKNTFEDSIVQLFEQTQGNFDVCMISYNPIQIEELPKYPFLLKVIEAQTTSGYLVQSHYYDDLINIWEDALEIMENNGPEYKHTHVCDQSWKVLQKKDNWVCFKNNLGIQKESYSDIQKEMVNYQV
jgi:hypothetical protein